MAGYPNIGHEVTVRDYVPGQPIPALIVDKATGRVVKNPLKRFVRPYTLSIEPSGPQAASQSVLTLPVGEQTDFIPMPIDGKGHFEIMQSFFKSEQEEGFTVELFDPDHRPILMNREVHVATIASGGGTATLYEAFGAVGSAGRAFRWPDTLFLDEKLSGKCLFARFRNLSASENDIRFTLHGQKWYNIQAPQPISDRMQQIFRSRFRTMPYFYTTDQFGLLAADDTTTLTMRFDDKSWTEWLKSMMISSDDDFNVRISETESNKRYMENFVPAVNVFGDGEFPFLNWESGLFEPSYQLSFEFENPSVEDITLWLTFGCRMIMPDPLDYSMIRPNQAAGGGM